jgi:hypothetical protein
MLEKEEIGSHIVRKSKKHKQHESMRSNQLEKAAGPVRAAAAARA